MKKMTKLLSLFLTLTLVVALFAGCGSADEDKDEVATTAKTTEKEAEGEAVTEPEPLPEPEVVTGITSSITVQVEEGWLPVYETAKARVLANNPDSSIEFIVTGSFDHLDVLDATDVMNEDVADVFALPADRLYPLAQNDVLAAIDAKTMAANVGGFDNYDAGLGGNFNIDGDYLAFPMNIETLINFANTANAEAKGVDLSGTIEFTELAYDDMLIPAFNAWFGVAIANAGGIEMLGMNDDGTLYSDLVKDYADLNAQQQEVFTALYEFWKSHDEMGTDMWDSSATWGYMDAEFTTGGNNVLRLEGPWSTGNLSALAGDGADLAILPINQVTVAGYPMTHWKGGWGLGVNARVEADADQMLLAQAMIEEIVNPAFAIEFFEATGKILENVDFNVYVNSSLPDTDKVVIAAVLQSYADAPARPLFTEWGQVWATWENAILSWASLKPATVEDAYKEVKAAFDAMMLNF